MRACDAKEHKCFYECPYYNTREVCDTNIFDPSLGKLAKPDFHFIPQKFMELPKAIPIPTPIQEEVKEEAKPKEEAQPEEKEVATPKYKVVESKGKSKGKSKRKRKWQTLDEGTAAKVDKEILETEVKND